MKIRHIAIFLILLVCLVGAVSAADDVADDTLDVAADDTVAVDNVQEEVSEDVSQDPTGDDTLQAQDNNDELKTGTKTVEVNNINELTNAINGAVADSENDTYIINLNPGTYKITANTAVKDGANHPNIIINGNSQTLSASKTSYKLTLNNCNITINNLSFTTQLVTGTSDLTLNQVSLTKTVTNNANLKITKSTIDTTINNKVSLTIDDDTVFGANALISGNGILITTNPNAVPYLSVYDGNYELKGVTFSTTRTNKGNLTIINSIINGKNLNRFTNEGILTIINCTLDGVIVNSGHINIDDNTTFGSNLKFTENEGSTVSCNNINELIPYFISYSGDYTFENMNVNLQEKSNYGTLHFINCTLTSTSFTNEGNIYIINSTSNAFIKFNNGNMYVENSTINSKITLGSDAATLIIDDNSKVNTFIDNNKGNVICNDSQLIYNLAYIAGDYNISDFTFDFNKITFGGNIILINCTFDASQFNVELLVNKGNLTIFNSTVNNGVITNNGNLIINNLTLATYNRIQNNGNLTINDINMDATNTAINNKGFLRVANNPLKLNSIENYGIVSIDIDEGKEVEEVYGSNFGISNMANGAFVQTNDLAKLFPYIYHIYQDAILELGDYNKGIQNYGDLTILNSRINGAIANGWSNNPIGKLTLINTTITDINNHGTLDLRNVTVNGYMNNYGTLIISDDTQFTENFTFANRGEVITNNTDRFVDYISVYYKDVVLNNKTIDTPKINRATLTLNNCTFNSTIANYGSIIIDEYTVFGENAQITGSGDVIVNGDISRALSYISVIKGNHLISDKALNKTYTFYGTITLNNCTITSSDNLNYATLILNNCTVDVGEDNTFLTNLQTVHISRDTTINGKIIDLSNGVEYENEPQNTHKTYVITQDTIKYFLDGSGLNSVINPGDTLDIRGRIILNNSLLINKPVNIISSTNDGYIDLNTTAGDYFGSSQGNSFIILDTGAYTNVTGVYFHNTQLWIYGTHHVTFDKVSVVVDHQRVGSGVGITSIREGSSYITVKNSYFHTTDNEGSSTLVLAVADYCTIENNTIEGDGFVGNLMYLTTYNVMNVPSGMYNSHNKIINNRLRGPEKPTSTCYAICISGFDNLVENNTITYDNGYGIMFQWGSGITGIETAGNESLVGSGENIVRNNKVYGGCGIQAGDIIYNNYIEGKLTVPANSKAYNNTANRLEVGPDSEVTNNTILGKVTFHAAAKNSVIANNTIKGNIEIPTTVTNVTLADNDVTGSITLDGSFNNLTNNRIITNDEYAVSSNKLGKNNTLEGNYLVANGKVGNDAVSLRDPSNVIASAGVATKVEVSVPGEVTVNKTVQVTIKLTDANGNPLDGQVTVSSALGSETVNITKGTGVYQYTPKAIGEDTISVKFAGNDTFYLSSNSSNVNVIAEKAPAQQNETKTPTKTPTKTVVSLSFVKAPKKVSKKAKKLIISAKLKVNGKLAKGKKLTFKFKGKTFKVKTNKKGVAKLTIKSKVLKKLLKKVKAGKKVKYQVSYGKKTVKKTLKVKK